MTIAPDPAEITPPSDPAVYGARRTLGVGVWALIAVCILSVIVGAAVVRFGPGLLWGRKPAAVEAPAAPLAPFIDAPRMAPAPAPELAGAPTSAEVAALQARVTALEASQARTVDAAAAALASASLAEATQTSRAFYQELAALERVLPMSTDIQALRGMAEAGAPSRAALAAEFDDAAAKAAVAARDPGEDAGLLARIGHALSTIVTIRRIDSSTGAGPDAVLARAGRQVEDGDIEGALRTLNNLSPAGREAMAGWLRGAERRALIDRHVSAIRAGALADLAQVSRNRP